MRLSSAGWGLVGLLVAAVGFMGDVPAGEAEADAAAALWRRASASEAVRDEDAEAQLVALGEDAALALGYGLAASEGWRRERAAVLLERLGVHAGPAVPQLADALHDRSWTVRRQAAYALAAAGEAARASLSSLWWLVSVAPEPPGGPAQELPTDRDAAAWALVGIDGGSAETLRRLLLHRKGPKSLLYTYLEADPARLPPMLDLALACDSWRVRDHATWVLRFAVGKVEDGERWLPTLRDLVARDPAPAVRISAARVLNRIVGQDGRAVPSDIAAAGLQGDDAEVRRLAVSTLAFLPVEEGEVLAALGERLTTDPDADVRRLAAAALRHAGDDASRGALEAGLGDDEVAPAAALALACRGSREEAVLARVARLGLAGRTSMPGREVLVWRGGRRMLGGQRKAPDLGALAEETLEDLHGAALPSVEAHLGAADALEATRAILLAARLGEAGKERVRKLLGETGGEWRGVAAAALLAAGDEGEEVVRALLDAAAGAAEREAGGVWVEEDAVDWGMTAEQRLTRAKAPVAPLVLAHARELLRRGASGRALRVHAVVLRDLGRAARPTIDAAFEDPVLAPWLRQVVETTPAGQR